MISIRPCSLTSRSSSRFTQSLTYRHLPTPTTTPPSSIRQLVTSPGRVRVKRLTGHDTIWHMEKLRDSAPQTRTKAPRYPENRHQEDASHSIEESHAKVEWYPEDRHQEDPPHTIPQTYTNRYVPPIATGRENYPGSQAPDWVLHHPDKRKESILKESTEGSMKAGVRATSGENSLADKILGSGPDIRPPTKTGSARRMSLPDMDIARTQTVQSVRALRREASAKARLVGLVPTMGALHDGHLDLIKAAAMECEEVIVSIYVNPTQFGVGEDLSSYPRTMDKDMKKLFYLNMRIVGQPKYKGRVTMVFSPSDDVMYPVGVGPSSHVIMNPSLTGILEGNSRPNFFQGVSTVVTKLLNIIQPDKVYFGQKDIQQLIVVQRMINEFWLPTELRCVRTRRHEDGMAMSSRNVYLGRRRRAVALSLYKVLDKAQSRYKGGLTTRKYILDMTRDEANKLREAQMSLPPNERARFEIDYISLADPVHLREVDDEVDETTGAILSGAFIMLPLEEAQEGEPLGLGDDARQVRLIDNMLLGNAENIGEKPNDTNT